METLTKPFPLALCLKHETASDATVAELEKYVAVYDGVAVADGCEPLLEAVGGLDNVLFVECARDVLDLMRGHRNAGLAYNSVISRETLGEDNDLWTLHYVGEGEMQMIVVSSEAAELARVRLLPDGGSGTPTGSIAWFGLKEAK